MALICLSVSSVAGKPSGETERQLANLDMLIEHQEDFSEEKENKINDIKKIQGVNLSLRERFEFNERIFNEYLVFNTDSAMKYATDNQTLAKLLDDRNLILRANLKIAYAYSSTGQFNGAMDILNKISPDGMTEDLKIEYFGTLCNIYSRLAEYSDRRDDMRGHFYSKEFIYADSVLERMSPKDDYFLVYRGWRDQRMGNIPQLIDDLEKHFSSDSRNNYINSQLLYLLACLYKPIDRDKYLETLIRVAEMDVRICNNDSRAFADLANELFRRGDIKDAYKYMSYCMDIAIKANNRVRMVSIMEDMNSIQQQNSMLQRKSNRHLLFSLCCIVGMSIVLLIAIILIIKQIKKTSLQRHNELVLNDKLNEANTKLSEANDMLHESNVSLAGNVAELTKMHEAMREAKSQVDELNAKLVDANRALHEQNAIKEEYIGFVLMLCSDYISKLDEYRKNIKQKITARKYDDLKDYIFTPILMQKEIKEFHKSFDAIFTHVFPTFVEDFNSLLQPDQRFAMKDDNTLNTDLRIFALMHLGITDSGKIADFLHVSLQTVYNSRLKTRSKAISRDTFDTDVRNFGAKK